MELEQKVVGLLEGHFKVEAYQRGYRWEKDEIIHLLEDIDEHPGQSYCLQPVVVKKVKEEKDYVEYELIDGQQRLTTLYLIMKYLNFDNEDNKGIKYSIEYATREGSKKLLENIREVDLDEDESKANNIDELFITKAYKTISDWFNGDKAKMLLIAGRLLNDITIIWYEVDKDEDSIGIFTRLNIGKINLTNAELVKALFLSRGKKEDNGVYAGNRYGIADKKQHEIALQWDAMEKGLHDHRFWAFITNEKKDRYPVRMELLFDIMEDKPNNEDNFYTFNKFLERFNKERNGKGKVWETVVRYYQQLQEWYNDFDLFHQIGYLVAAGHNIKELLDMVKDKKKSEFKKEILEMIRESVDFKTPDGKETIDYADLNYEEHKGFIQTLLLLFNVETIRQKGDHGNRFPFERYKKGTWSLEHIHAQNSEPLRTKKQWFSWLDLHVRSLQGLKNDSNPNEVGNIDAVIKKMEDVKNHIKDVSYEGSIRDEFEPVAAEVVKLLTADGEDELQMHSLSNMALLTVGENAALSNTAFDAKRIKIIEMDKAGDYIPPCTRNVFLKYYSKSDTKLHFWAQQDREDYIEAMNEALLPYMTEPTTGKTFN